MNLCKQLAPGLTLMLGGLLLATTLSASPSNKWRLEFSGSARSDGNIVILIDPIGAASIRTETAIQENTRENMVAEAVVQSLRKQLPQDGFHIERDDGEDVLIKKRHGAADFSVEILSNTVENVRINPDRE
jgi:hypothetical protein